MTLEEKLGSLKNEIMESLASYISGDYVLWDVPYYSNIGDTLIWEGELHFLRKCDRKCLGQASKETCCFPYLPSGTVILLQGGGNFGDLWREHQEFRLEVVRKYPKHRIIMFPQSVYYKDENLMKQDAREMARHPDLILCARDCTSYVLLQENFNNQVLLVPDMAFCISVNHLKQYCQREEHKILFLKRSDKELSRNCFYPENIESHDWPSMDRRMWEISLLGKGLGLIVCFKKKGWNYLHRYSSRMIDRYAQQFLRPALIRTGVEFVSRYCYVYTTRLHVMILSVLLGKECTFFDNSYGKNSAFYETWLKDLPGVKRAN